MICTAPLASSFEPEADFEIGCEAGTCDRVFGIVDPDDYADMTVDEIAALEVWEFDPETDAQHDDERGAP